MPQTIDNELTDSLDHEENYVSEELDNLEKTTMSAFYEEPKQEETKTEEKKVERSKKVNRISVVCASCGRVVKVREDETICPKCDEPLKED